MGCKCYHNIIKIESQQFTHEINEKNNVDLSNDKTLNSLNNKSELEKKFSLKKRLTNKNKEVEEIKEIIDKKKKEDLRKNIKNDTINAKNEDFKEDYEKSIITIIKKNNKNNEDKELINNCLMKHFFMKDLEEQTRNEIIKEMILALVKENTYIYKQGGIGNYFYILKEGKIEIIPQNKSKIKELHIGESFGELALLHEAKRPESARTITECYLWIMERKNFKKIVEYITKKNYEENKQFIESIPILSNIDNTQKSLLCSSLYKESFDEGKYIVREGDPAQCLYIVKEGEVNCILKGKIVRTLRKGDNFGERSVLIDSTRSLDCVAKTKCICYSVSSSTLETMLGKNFRNLLYLNFIKSSFTRSKIFNKFNVNLLDNVFQLFKPFNLTKNEIAYKEGYIKSSKIVVVIDGNLINNITNDIVANRGDVLFEDELYEGLIEKTDFDIIPQPDCLLVEADSIQFFNLLGGNFQRLMEKTSVINCLSKVQIFKNLPRKKLVELSEKIIEENFEDGKSIVKEGENGNKFYIIKSGKVEILVNGKYIRTLNESEYFGERALFFHEKRSATINAIGEVCLFSISQKDFENIIENNLKEHLLNRLYLQDNTIELNDLLFCFNLGAGNYGNVCLVRNKKNKFPYAIKAISKKQIDYDELHQNLELERGILLKIEHPFIVKLVKTLKDNKFIYFLMEYIKGKELFEVIRDIGLLNKAETQFYSSSLLLAIDYLHERKIIYRDIKPENIMVIESGYLKLIDFGTSKEITDRTDTIIGTPHYMAPEVILGEGYSFQIDIWSIAICMYEFICGKVPFGEEEEDPMDVYLDIVNINLTFPHFINDNDFKSLMEQMLTKNPINRLSKFSEVKKHIWFNNFNWDDLMTLTLKPPYLPKLNNNKNIEENIPWNEYSKNLKEPPDNKNIQITSEAQKEFDEWFIKF